MKIVGDLTSDDFVKKLVEHTINKFERIDIVFNNAGQYIKAGIEDPNFIGQLDAQLAVNLRAPAVLNYHVVPHLKITKGTIIHTSSIASSSAVSSMKFDRLSDYRLIFY